MVCHIKKMENNKVVVEENVRRTTGWWRNMHNAFGSANRGDKKMIDNHMGGDMKTVAMKMGDMKIAHMKTGDKTVDMKMGDSQNKHTIVS